MALKEFFMREHEYSILTFRCSERQEEDVGVTIPVLTIDLSYRIFNFSSKVRKAPYSASHSLIRSLSNSYNLNSKCADIMLGREPDDDRGLAQLYNVTMINKLPAVKEMIVTLPAKDMKNLAETLMVAVNFINKKEGINPETIPFIQRISDEILCHVAPVLKSIDVNNRRASMKSVSLSPR
jgi:hypothetical protein